MKKATGGKSYTGKLKVTTPAGLNKAYRDQAKKSGSEGPKKSSPRKTTKKGR